MIDVKRFEEIKAKQASLKERIARAEGAKETILETLKKEFGITDMAQLDAFIAEETATITENNEILDKLFAELEGVTNWRLV